MNKYGCSDHMCVYGHPRGMGTNGGCNCLDGLRPRDKSKITVTLRRYRELCASLEEENKQLKSLRLTKQLDHEELHAKILSLSCEIENLKMADQQLVAMYKSKTKEALSLLKREQQLKAKFSQLDADRTRMASTIDKEINTHFRPITYDFQHEKVLDRIEKIWGADENSPESLELHVLAIIASKYEELRYPIEKPTKEEQEAFFAEQKLPKE